MPKTNTFPFQIKICGLTQPQQAIDARQAGADAIGLNFFEPSIRYVDVEQASLIVAAVAKQAPDLPIPAPRVVGVFVNHSVNQILRLATTLGLDGIQMHGDETIEFFDELKQAVAVAFEPDSRPFFVRAIRTQPAAGQSVADKTLTDRAVEARRIVDQIQTWSRSGIDTILLDAAATGEFGGTGKSIDWSLFPELQTAADRPLALAGGLTPDNVGRAIQISQAQIIDVASGVEAPKGVKCPKLVFKFVQQARRALDSNSDLG